MKVFRRKEGPIDEDNIYWISFSDIMSSLLIIFILAAIVLIMQLIEATDSAESSKREYEAQKQEYQKIVIELQQREAQLDRTQVELEKQKQEAEERKREAEESKRQAKEVQQQYIASQALFDAERDRLRAAERVRKTILQEAAGELNRLGIDVSVSENYTVLSIPNEILGFESSRYELQEQYHSAAKLIGEVLSRTIRRNDRIVFLDTIFVEGHTDKIPYGGLMGTGNWGLSSFRAISLWQFWMGDLSEENRLDLLKNNDDQPLFSVSGYGPTRPINLIQNTEAQLRANRRIDIRFTIRRPSSAEYDALKSRMGDL